MAMSPSSFERRTKGIPVLLSCAAILCSSAASQELMQPATPGGEVRHFTTDSAVLESTENRKDLPCTVTPVKPVLGFDMKFHAGH